MRSSRVFVIVVACAVIAGGALSAGCAPYSGIGVTRVAEQPDDGTIEYLRVGNVLAVGNDAIQPSFEVTGACLITEITTYHWNDGAAIEPGNVGLEDELGNVYGPWLAEGTEGPGGTPGERWTVTPDTTLTAGTYTVIDSDPDTWAQNEASGGRGITMVIGKPIAKEE